MDRPIMATLVLLLPTGAAAQGAANRPRSNVELRGIYLLAFEPSDPYPHADRRPATGKRGQLAPELSSERATDLPHFLAQPQIRIASWQFTWT